MEEGLFIGEGRVSLLNKKGSNSCDTVSVTSRIYIKNEDSRNIINIKPLWFLNWQEMVPVQCHTYEVNNFCDDGASNKIKKSICIQFIM